MIKTRQGRGQLTQRIKDRSVELLGYEMDVTELRLMPYIIHVMMNDQKLDPCKCNEDDRVILKKWRDAGHIDGGVSNSGERISFSHIGITEEFWNIICEIVRLGYVDVSE